MAEEVWVVSQWGAFTLELRLRPLLRSSLKQLLIWPPLTDTFSNISVTLFTNFSHICCCGLSNHIGKALCRIKGTTFYKLGPRSLGRSVPKEHIAFLNSATRPFSPVKIYNQPHDGPVNSLYLSPGCLMSINCSSALYISNLLLHLWVR
jgi:hypothetical protein